VLNRHRAVELGSADETGDTRTFAVDDYESASRLAEALRSIDGVESAYAKPADELP
jgi:hypothetical protein